MPMHPGWYQHGNHPLRWWDGTTWSDPTTDPRYDPRHHSVLDGATLEFHAPVGWPTPPPNWYPPPLWEPELSWPSAVVLWSVRSLDWDTRKEEEANVGELLSIEKYESAWQFTGIEHIPLTWVPPPNWPPVPPQWSPPEKWKPDRRWGSAPAGWKFWQPDPTTLQRRITEVEERGEERTREALETTTGARLILELADLPLCESVTTTTLSRAPLPVALRHNFKDPGLPAQQETLTKAHENLNWHVSNLRTYILRIVHGLGTVDHWAWTLRRNVHEATQRQHNATVSALTRAMNLAFAEVSRAIPKINPRRPEDGVHIDALLAEVKQSVHHRNSQLEESSRQLERIFQVLTEPDRAANAAPAATQAWEVAEELAATHLRTLGFTDAHRTPPGSDGGIDIEGRGIIAQVKAKATPVPRPDIQRLLGTNQYGAATAFYSTAGYTQGAIDFANHVNVALFTLDLTTNTATAINDAGTNLHA